jgi:pimeloyl-ACP methyl ester carboxylesterase
MVVVVDRPGFGSSDFGRAEKSLARQSELLGNVLKSYPNKKKILVGHSLGGPVIAKMAIDFPEEVSAIVILAGSVDPELEPNEWFRKPMASPLIRWMIPTVFTASNDEIVDLKNELELMLPEWKKITAPVTVIQGTSDDLVPQENAAFVKKMVVNAPVRLRMLDGESHFFPFSRPEIEAEELMLGISLWKF